MQNDKKWVCVEIPLQATETAVWSALTDSKLTQRYMYNCQLHSSWEVGSDAIWKEEQSDGTFTTHVRAKVLEFTPYAKLRFTIFHENKEFGACESELKFTILKQDSGVILKIEQGDFTKLPNGIQSYDDCLMGRNYITKDLRTTIEEFT